MQLNDFFASTNEQYWIWFIWQLFYTLVLYGSFRPIWTQNEVSQPHVSQNNATTSPSNRNLRIRHNVVHYGWQTRKRNEWNNKHYARWMLLNPDYFYSGVIWFVLFLCAGYGCYYVMLFQEERDLRTVALWIAAFQGSWFGTWSIPGFYWDLPGWSVIHLFIGTSLSIAVSILFGVMEEYTGMAFYIVYTVGQIIMFTIFFIAYIVSIYRGEWKPHKKEEGGRVRTQAIGQETLIYNARIAGGYTKGEARHNDGSNNNSIGNILRSFWVYGLYPISYLEKDLVWVLFGKYQVSPPLGKRQKDIL
jgi:hypothetical protein